MSPPKYYWLSKISSISMNYYMRAPLHKATYASYDASIEYNLNPFTWSWHWTYVDPLLIMVALSIPWCWNKSPLRLVNVTSECGNTKPLGPFLTVCLLILFSHLLFTLSLSISFLSLVGIFYTLNLNLQILKIVKLLKQIQNKKQNQFLKLKDKIPANTA